MGFDWKSWYRFAFSVLCVSVIAVTAAYFVSSLLALMVAGVTFVVLFLLRGLQPGAGATRVRLLSLALISGVALSYQYWAPAINALTKALAEHPLIKAHAPWLGKVALSDGPPIAILVFVTVGLWIVHHYMADRSIGGNHPVALRKEFPEPSFKDELVAFCSVLDSHLTHLDLQSNWSPNYYTPLESEVEIIPANGERPKRRVVDLQRALRLDRTTQCFLVLGDPGAGKSVALRKLARDMLREVGTSGRIPIYVNLREWLPKEGRRAAGWSENKPPTFEELENFVIDNIDARGDVFASGFRKKYFRDLWQHGRLFFIFDSFDEIPELLDANEESWLIDALSSLLHRFVASRPKSRGIVASRQFRRPSIAYQAQKVLEIRPMTEDRIVRGLSRFSGSMDDLKTRLFRERPDLVPIARNPFLMTLLGEWVGAHGELPRTQAQLYASYLRARLDQCSTKIRQYGLTQDEVLDGATRIAWFIFDSPEYGLEAPVRVIGDAGATAQANAIIDVLSYARIARTTSGDTPSFSFVHRRFLEYFVTMKLLEGSDAAPIEHIPTDSRGRDALVLYAQLCDDPKAEQIALLCWREIQENFNVPESRIRAVHSLRFLTDAFYSRRQALAPIARELEEFIRQHVEKGRDILLAKKALEAVSLIDDARRSTVIAAAMNSDNSWLRETAFRASRYIPFVDGKLFRTIAEYVELVPSVKLWQQRRELLFSLSLSDAMSGVRRVAVLRIVNLYLSLAAISVAITLFLPLLSASLVLYVIFFLFLRSKETSPLLVWIKNSRFRLVRREKLGQADGLGALGNIDLFRVFLGVVSIIAGFLVFGRPGEISIWELNFSRFVAGTLAIVLGVASFEWMDLARATVAVVRTRVTYLLAGLGVLVGVASFALAFILFIDFLIKLLSKKILIIIMLVFFVAFFALPVVAWLSSLIKHERLYRKDSNIVNALRFGQTLSRVEISKALRSLKTKRGRLAYLRLVAREKSQVEGDWPDGFELLVSDDPVVTELAKLEERWRKLDR